MGDGQNGKSGVNVLQIVGQELIQEHERVLHRSHQEPDCLAQEKTPKPVHAKLKHVQVSD